MLATQQYISWFNCKEEANGEKSSGHFVYCGRPMILFMVVGGP